MKSQVLRFVVAPSRSLIAAGGSPREALTERGRAWQNILMAALWAGTLAAVCSAQTVERVKGQPDKAPDSSSLQSIVDTITRGCKNNDEKAVAIYKWLRNEEFCLAWGLATLSQDSAPDCETASGDRAFHPSGHAPALMLRDAPVRNEWVRVGARANTPCVV